MCFVDLRLGKLQKPLYKCVSSYTNRRFFIVGVWLEQINFVSDRYTP